MYFVYKHITIFWNNPLKRHYGYIDLCLYTNRNTNRNLYDIIDLFAHTCVHKKIVLLPECLFWPFPTSRDFEHAIRKHRADFEVRFPLLCRVVVVDKLQSSKGLCLSFILIDHVSKTCAQAAIQQKVTI